jgi:hypothetical protein
VEHVRLTGAIYVELLALRAPIVKEVQFFEQKQKNREFEDELEVTLNFLRITTTFTIAPTT